MESSTALSATHTHTPFRHWRPAAVQSLVAEQVAPHLPVAAAENHQNILFFIAVKEDFGTEIFCRRHVHARAVTIGTRSCNITGITKSCSAITAPITPQQNLKEKNKQTNKQTNKETKLDYTDITVRVMIRKFFDNHISSESRINWHSRYDMMMTNLLDSVFVRMCMLYTRDAKVRQFCKHEGNLYFII